MARRTASHAILPLTWTPPVVPLLNEGKRHNTRVACLLNVNNYPPPRGDLIHGSTNHKHQITNKSRFGDLILVLEICLRFGAWVLELGRIQAALPVLDVPDSSTSAISDANP